MTLAVSVLVMAVPEGLPMMITLVLSTNSKKMLKNKVLVRKMVGIETAGSLNILFTDKTGTITNGKMEVISILDGSLNEYTNINELLPSYRQILIDSIIYNNDSEYDSTTNKIIGGNITDKALLSFAGQSKKDTIKIIDKIMFNSQNKHSISIIEKNNKKMLHFILKCSSPMIKHITLHHKQHQIFFDNCSSLRLFCLLMQFHLYKNKLSGCLKS